MVMRGAQSFRERGTARTGGVLGGDTTGEFAVAVGFWIRTGRTGGD